MARLRVSGPGRFPCEANHECQWTAGKPEPEPLSLKCKAARVTRPGPGLGRRGRGGAVTWRPWPGGRRGGMGRRGRRGRGRRRRRRCRALGMKSIISSTLYARQAMGVLQTICAFVRHDFQRHYRCWMNENIILQQLQILCSWR